MTDDPSRFRVIDGGPKVEDPADPKKRRKRYRAKKGEPEVLTCSTCEADIGVSTALTFEAKQGRMIRDGKTFAGDKAIYCAACLSRGKLTRLV